MQVEITTVLTLITAVLSLIGTAASFGVMKQKLDAMYVDRERWRSELEKKTDSQAIENAAIKIRIEALQTKLTDNYMLKPDIIAIEERVSGRQKEIVTKVDSLDGKIDRITQILLQQVS
jgi:hypothetical protein